MLDRAADRPQLSTCLFVRAGPEHVRCKPLRLFALAAGSRCRHSAFRDVDVFGRRNLHLCAARAPPLVGPRGSSSNRGAWSFGRARLSGRTIADFSRAHGSSFNRAFRGECNLRAFEAAAAGALLFQESGHRGGLRPTFGTVALVSLFEPRTLRRSWTIFFEPRRQLCAWRSGPTPVRRSF